MYPVFYVLHNFGCIHRRKAELDQLSMLRLPTCAPELMESVYDPLSFSATKSIHELLSIVRRCDDFK